MKQLNIAVIFGGTNTEHEVSLVSARSILNNLNPKKYHVLPIKITKDNRWLATKQLISGSQAIKTINNNSALTPQTPYQITRQHHIDVVFPVLHGPYGEDGTIQGLLELIRLPYVGCNVLASAICMDKIIQKQLCAYHHIPIAKYIHTHKHEWIDHHSQVISRCQKELDYPVFVKPANQGSSIGITKAANKPALKTAIEHALTLDTKVIIEAAVPNAREIECSVLGNHHPKTSILGEIIPSNDYYDYNAKYINGQSKEIIPAKLNQKISQNIRQTAIKAFKVLNCSGLARVDFLVKKGTNKFYLNELNTMPGFTSISMYPKLWQASGLSYPILLDKLIALALERHPERSQLNLNYQPKTNWHHI